MSDDTFAFAGIEDYASAYRERRFTPLDLVDRVLGATAESEAHDPPLRIFISQADGDLRAQARESGERHAAGEPRGPLDGVPIAVKDELDQAGYGTTAGTSFLGRTPAAADATTVARLRAAGALLIGKTNMHEIGLGITGINPHHGAARNPYSPDRMTGGSSSGPAVAVAAGLCPAALGADGGGSIRIPAALCGIAGIKPTFGRVSEVGAVPLCWSVAHVGPLAASVRDAATILELIAGPDPGDPNTLGQPPLDLETIDDHIEGLQVGWCERWASEASPEVLSSCAEALARLEAAGAKRVELELEHLELVRTVQYITIGVEMAASQYEHRREHAQSYGADTRLLLGLASRVPAVDYVRAQRARSMIHDELVRALGEVDVIASPMTALPAPPIPPDALKDGLSDDAVLAAMTAFSFLANLTGQPALSVPVGYSDEGLPIGMQLIGRHWDEATLIRAALAVEERFQRRRPEVLFELLGE